MDCLFRVLRKLGDIPVDVYNIKKDKNGYPLFLIYEDNEWKYVEAKHFVPIDYSDYNF